MGNGSEHTLIHLAPIAARAGLESRTLELADTITAIIDRGGWPSRAAAYARYNLACFHALSGNLDVARSLLRLALPDDEELRGFAPTDDDLIALRDEMPDARGRLIRGPDLGDDGRITDPERGRAARLDELAFLHEIAQLATLARDWDELMHSIVDGTTAAMGVEVCSFYLADHERTRLTLAATNGLDRSQVGRVSLAWGEGITGRVGRHRAPRSRSRTSRVDERFAWVRGFDIEGLAGMLSVPLEWHDDGGRRPQRPDPREAPLRATTRSPCCGRSPRCWPGSSRRAG